MESGTTMLFHSIVIGIVLYVFMTFILGQRQIVAENRSIVISAFALIYMIMFGHGLPRQINKDL
jgi:hypothetical protein